MKAVSIAFAALATTCPALAQSENPIYLNNFAELDFYAADGMYVGSAAGRTEFSVPWSADMKIVALINPAKSVDLVRISDQNAGNGQCDFVADDPDHVLGNNSLDDPSAPFTFHIKAQSGQSSCIFRLDGWQMPAFDWQGQTKNFTVHFDGAPSAAPQYHFTVGTDQSTELYVETANVGRPSHGVRFHCPVSHFSYDDPIVHPNEPGDAHLHMFWGNVTVDAFTNAGSLVSSGDSTCDPGTNNRSAYWTPALFNAQDEVVIPDEVIVYYKTFADPGYYLPNGDLPPGFLQPIPDGFSMLASGATKNASGGKLKAVLYKTDKLELTLAFPECIAIDSVGAPVLSHEAYKNHPNYNPNGAATNQHVSYTENNSQTSNECPVTHPYRIPGLKVHLRYESILFSSAWYLASDVNKSDHGLSLHGDYIAAWDDVSMDQIVTCVEDAHNCTNIGKRGVLSERFFNEEGVQLYSNSASLAPATDLTPFGNTLTRSLP